MAGRSVKARMSGLRASDPTTLSIMTQDLIRRPLIHLHEGTLCDLIALSEVETLPYALKRDLGRFRDQMFREIDDLPDGTPLQGFLTEIAAIDVGNVPESVRDLLSERADDPKLMAETQQAFEQLQQSFAETEPSPVVVKEVVKARVERPHVPNSHRTPDERKKRRAAAGTRTARAKATPAAQRDVAREIWIRGDVLERLANYPGNGLKQAILVAGARHRAPWKDMADHEIMAVLRALKREDKVHFSAGRWSVRSGRYN